MNNEISVDGNEESSHAMSLDNDNLTDVDPSENVLSDWAPRISNINEALRSLTPESAFVDDNESSFDLSGHSPPVDKATDCHICGVFVGRSLTTHLRKVHEVFSCRFCKKDLKSLVALRSHAKSHSKTRFCNKRSRSHNNEMAIQNSFNGRLEAEEEYDDDGEEDSVNYDHVVTDCQFCGLSFEFTRDLLKHIISNHPTWRTDLKTEAMDLIKPCLMCYALLFLPDIANHMARIHNIDKKRFYQPMICDECDEDFVDRELYDEHCLRHQTGNKETKEEVESSPQLNYRCKVCSISFGYKEVLRRHEYIVHEGHTEEEYNIERPYKCTICPSQFALQAVLLRHELIHKKERPFICKMCQKTYKRRDQLKSHITTTHQDVLTERQPEDLMAEGVELCDATSMPVACDNCRLTFINGNSLAKHDCITELRKLPVAIWKHHCSICDRYFMSEFDMEEHTENCHTRERDEGDMRRFSCQYCNKKYSRKEHVEKHSAKCASGVGRPAFSKFNRKEQIDGVYLCSTCLQLFIMKVHLIRHVQCHELSDSRQFKCLLCPSYFSELKGRRMHVIAAHRLIPSKKLGYPCLLCRMPSCTPTEALLHSQKCQHLADPSQPRRHTNIKPSCESRGYDKGELSTPDKDQAGKRHKNSDENSCGHCGKPQSSYIALRRHVLQCHPRNLEDLGKYPCCRLCNERFLFNYELKRHMLKHDTKDGSMVDDVIDAVEEQKNQVGNAKDSSKPGQKCSFCGETFIHYNSMRRHLLKSHRKELDPSQFHACAICDLLFTYKSELSKHELTHVKSCNVEEEDKLRGNGLGTDEQGLEDVGVSKESQALPVPLGTDLLAQFCYKCENCSLFFNSSDRHEDHKMTCQPNEDGIVVFRCSGCDRSFREFIRLRAHMKTCKLAKLMEDQSRLGGIFICFDCCLIFIHQWKYLRHLQHHGSSDERVHPCVFCRCYFNDKSAVRKHSLKVHMLNNSSHADFACQVCFSKFATKDDALSHYKVCWLAKQLQNIDCLPQQEMGSSVLLVEPTPVEPLTSSNVEALLTFKKEVNLPESLDEDIDDSVGGIEPSRADTLKINEMFRSLMCGDEKFGFRCTICNEGHVTYVAIKRHLLACHPDYVDTSLFPECKQCHQKFLFKCDLRRHLERKHDDNSCKLKDCLAIKNIGKTKVIRPIKIKSRTRDRRTSVLARKKIHSCEYCSLKNMDHKAKKRHQLRHHRSKIDVDEYYPCPICDMIYVYPTELTVHMDKKHPGLDENIYKQATMTNRTRTKLGLGKKKMHGSRSSDENVNKQSADNNEEEEDEEEEEEDGDEDGDEDDEDEDEEDDEEDDEAVEEPVEDDILVANESEICEKVEAVNAVDNSSVMSSSGRNTSSTAAALNECSHCGQKFRLSIALKRHIANHHS